MNYKSLQTLQTPSGCEIPEFDIEGEMQRAKAPLQSQLPVVFSGFQKRIQKDNGKSSLERDKLAEDFFSILKWFTGKKGSMVANGECILNRIKEYLDLYSFTREQVSYLLDFMGRRNVLSNDIIKKIKNCGSCGSLISKKSDQPFARSLYNFIKTRNAVTHGTQYVLLPQCSGFSMH